jgi:hypothetical protein
MTQQQDDRIDVLAGRCPTAVVRTRLSLALIERIDQAGGLLPRGVHLAIVIDAAMTREHPHLIDGAQSDRAWVERLAVRRYQQHVRTVQLARAGRQTATGGNDETAPQARTEDPRSLPSPPAGITSSWSPAATSTSRRPTQRRSASRTSPKA